MPVRITAVNIRPHSGPFISADEHYLMFAHGYDLFEIAR